MKNLLLIFLLPVFLFLYGCSWVRNFLIINTSSKPIDITFSVNIPPKGFYIFTQELTFYKTSSSGKIKWEKTITPTVEMVNKTTSSFKLDPNACVIIGRLYNDDYISHDQKFINDKVFNLDYLTIDTLKITPENFDNLFKKTRQGIVYQVE